MNESTREGEEVVARFGELARRAWQVQLDAAKQSFDIGRQALASRSDPMTASRAWARAARRENEQYWTEVGSLGADLAGRLITLWSRGVARVLADTQAATRQSRSGTHDVAAEAENGAAADSPGQSAGAPDSGESLHVPVVLHGAAGETAAGSVLLANPHPRARRVMLSPSGLYDASGRAVQMRLRVDPTAVTIPARAEQNVTVEADLPLGVAEAGAAYTGIIDVSGGVDAVVDVTVEVDSS